MTVLAVVLSVVGAVVLLRWRLLQPLMPESLYHVDFDESAVAVTFPQATASSSRAQVNSRKPRKDRTASESESCPRICPRDRSAGIQGFRQG